MGKRGARMNRGLLYSLTPDNGLVGDHVIHMLKSLRSRHEHIAVSVNGTLLPENAARLQPCADQIFQSPETKTIEDAYRAGLGTLGWDRIGQFDELSLMSCDLFGPIFPIEEMFAAMDAQTDLDLWGLSEAAPLDPPPTPTYLDQSFILFRKRLLQSLDFQMLWSAKLPRSAPNFDQRIAIDQAQFLAEKGYKSTAFLRLVDFLTPQPLLLEMQTALCGRRLPLLRFTPFCRSALYQDDRPANLNQVLPILERQSNYPQALFWQTALRRASLRTLHTNLAYQFTFDSNTYGGTPKLPANLRVAVCAHVYYPDVLEEILVRTHNIPTAYDLFITTATAENKAVIEARCAESGIAADVRVVQQNRGRDMSSLYIDLKDVVIDGGYDLICRLHSKRSPQVNSSTGTYFKHYIFDAVLASPAYTSHLLDFLVTNPHVGMAFAPMIHTGYATMGNGWFQNRDVFKRIMSDLSCDVPKEPYSPIAAYGTVYWFRPEALLPLFEGHYGYEDYNLEPNHFDGGLAHGQERAMTYIAQARGYMTATVWPDYVAAQSTTLMEYKMDSLYSHFRQGSTAPHSKLMSFITSSKKDRLTQKRQFRTPEFMRDFEKRNRGAIKKFAKRLGLVRPLKP
jgi:lipopolysaccharide biosynthesis protein